MRSRGNLRHYSTGSLHGCQCRCRTRLRNVKAKVELKELEHGDISGIAGAMPRAPTHAPCLRLLLRGLRSPFHVNFLMPRGLWQNTTGPSEADAVRAGKWSQVLLPDAEILHYTLVLDGAIPDRFLAPCPSVLNSPRRFGRKRTTRWLPGRTWTLPSGSTHTWTPRAKARKT